MGLRRMRNSRVPNGDRRGLRGYVRACDCDSANCLSSMDIGSARFYGKLGERCRLAAYASDFVDDFVVRGVGIGSDIAHYVATLAVVKFSAGIAAEEFV